MSPNLYRKIKIMPISSIILIKTILSLTTVLSNFLFFPPTGLHKT